MGVLYTYSNADRVRANAYVYPVPPERLGLDADTRVAQEATGFMEGLAAGVQQGRYREVRVIVMSPASSRQRRGQFLGTLLRLS